MGNVCCGESGSFGKSSSNRGHNRISRQLEQRISNYAATGIVPLRDARLTELPAFVEQLGDKVKTLDLTNNRLEAIPPSISNNYNLSRLTLAQNRLAQIPEEIGQLRNLKGDSYVCSCQQFHVQGSTARVLILDSNALQTLPASICGLEKLESLSVASNALATIPNEIGQLRKLKTITLSHNRLRELPSSLSRCSALEEIYASDNYLTAIPAELGGLDRLSLCNFDGNRIEAVPADVL
eukprot:scaffold201154_cov45-Prasinocladus_malaysianus.AAC.1